MATNFENLANNPLDGVLVSITRKLSYADVHIERMIKNNPGGIYDSLIELCKIKRDAFSNNAAEEEEGESLRIGHTAVLKKLSGNYKDEMSLFESLVRLKFGKGSQIYLEIFPHGLTYYRNAKQGEMLALMNKTISFNQTHLNELGTHEFLDKFVNIRDNFAKSLSSQQQAQGDVSNRKSLKDVLWNDLKKQLYIDMLSIIINNPDNPKQMLSYFDDKLLRFRHHKADGSDEATYKLIVAALSSKLADISYSPDDTLLIINNGNKSIFYYAAATADAPQPAVMHEIAAGDEAEVKALSLGAPANKFLIIVNKDATEEAEVEIALI